MHKQFTSLDDLFENIIEDKNWTEANAGQINRYPVRFVLFDNFADFYQFIVNRPAGIYKHSIDTMLDKNNPDEFLSYTELSKEIRAFTKKIPANDFIIYPFSEMARFYDNYDHNEFDSLVTTIRGQQAPEDAQLNHTRLYIPIVGMQGKMDQFMQDNSTYVWEYKSETDNGTYLLVITNGTTYNVSGLEEKYTVVHNLYEWLKLWEKGENVRKTIICSSPNIFANAHFAQPDNAFAYLECRNAYQFLTKGLNLDFGLTAEPSEEEMPFWEELAELVDITNFDFDELIRERLDTFTLKSGVDFIKSWFDCETDFDRWLLTLYFKKISNGQGYIYRAVSQCASLSMSELFSNIATLIFDEVNKEAYLHERRQAMIMAAERGIKITDLAVNKLSAKLSAIAASPESGGYYLAVKLLTPLTDAELQLCIEWVSRGKIHRDEIKAIFPQLYYYLEPLSLNSLDNTTQWIANYFDAYRRSKLADNIDSEVSEIISEKNANSASFRGWLDNFKTVKTVLYNRKDIDILYWIDGLGVDWIPFIRNIVSKYSKENIYLNEIYIATAELPTTTSVNKCKLQSLLPEGHQLPKIGDVDSFAHSSKSYPQYIIEEMKIVEDAVCKVLDQFNGKKIAFVSDHGITYLSQLVDGLKIGGIKTDHEGRLATYTSPIVDDNKYIKLDDGQTICSLTHHSLVDKVNKGHGAHGGCTPEEVLVPVIIVSSQKNATTYSASIVNDEIDATKPIVNFIIKGLSSIDVPTLVYNGVTYHLTSKGNNIYESERLNLVDTATKVTVCINETPLNSFSIKVSTGATEDDLFEGF